MFGMKSLTKFCLEPVSILSSTTAPPIMTTESAGTASPSFIAYKSPGTSSDTFIFRKPFLKKNLRFLELQNGFLHQILMILVFFCCFFNQNFLPFLIPHDFDSTVVASHLCNLLLILPHHENGPIFREKT